MSRLNRKRPIDYILPFLIMICAGIIVVLGYQLFSSMNQNEQDKEIYFYIAQGNAKILQWGNGEWERAYNGTRLLQGDALKTQKGGRVVIELFNDHYLRVNENSEITLSEIKKNGNAYEVSLIVREGDIWINSNENSVTPVKFTVKTDHTLIKTVSTIYEVEQHTDQEAIRVVKGSIVADIMVTEDGEQKKVESIEIGVGQQAVLTSEDIQDYTDRKSPSVIDAIDESFRNSGFYKWNMSEDNSPSDFTNKLTTIDESLFQDDTDTITDKAESDLVKPEITVPSTLDFTTTEDTLTIRGTTSFETKKMMVDVVSAGKSETYDLDLYVPGGTEWSFAVSEATETLNPGQNDYYFYSLDQNDLKSAKSKLVVTFDKEATDEENPDLPSLKAPTVDTFNGKSSNEVDVAEVKIIGSVDGAEEVIVDGYSLKAFEPGDTTWVYYAKESLGNLDPGENTYTVEAVAPDGTKKSTDFTIIYNKPETTEETPVTDTPATEEPIV